MDIPASLKECHLDHVAIAVSNLDERIKIYQDLGIIFSEEREIVEEQKVKTAFGSIDTHAHIELLEPTSSESPIAKHIEKRGEGLHHLCFRVTDVMSKQKEMEEKGYKFIYSEPQIGAGNCLVNFLHPKSGGGVLIEISQKQED